MQVRRLTENYAVSPQIAPDDVPEIAALGFRTVVNNRPDDEIPMELGSQVMRAAVEAAGLRYVELPLLHSTMTPERVAAQMATLEDGPVFAYCQSGTRCAVIWALGQAGRMPVDDILRATEAAGYDLGRLRGRLVGQAGG